MTEARETGKTLAVAAAIGLGLYFLSHKANATGNNPAAPPPNDPKTTDPVGQTKAQVTWIYNQLAKYGWQSQPVWWGATGPSEIPQDISGKGRQLPQSITDPFLGYFWDVNEFFGYSYPAGSGNSSAVPGAVLTAANTNTIQNDPTQWQNLQDRFAFLVANLNPTTLA